MDACIPIKVVLKGNIIYFCDLYGPPAPSLWTPWGYMDPWLRTYAIDGLRHFSEIGTKAYEQVVDLTHQIMLFE